MMDKLEASIEEVIKRFESALEYKSVLTPEYIEKLTSLKKRLEERKNSNKESSFNKDGLYEVGPNKEYFKDMQEILCIYRDVILPAMMHNELLKLRSIPSMISNSTGNTN